MDVVLDLARFGMAIGAEAKVAASPLCTSDCASVGVCASCGWGSSSTRRPITGWLTPSRSHNFGQRESQHGTAGGRPVSNDLLMCRSFPLAFAACELCVS